MVDAMSQLGYKMTPEDLEKVYSTLDTNKSGYIDFDEFMIVAAKTQLPS